MISWLRNSRKTTLQIFGNATLMKIKTVEN